MLEVRVFGTYVIRINEPSKFIKEIVGTDGYFTLQIALKIAFIQLILDYPYRDSL